MAHRVGAEMQLLRDLRVAISARQQQQNLALTRRQIQRRQRFERRRIAATTKWRGRRVFFQSQQNAVFAGAVASHRNRQSGAAQSQRRGDCQWIFVFPAQPSGDFFRHAAAAFAEKSAQNAARFVAAKHDATLRDHEYSRFVGFAKSATERRFVLQLRKAARVIVRLNEMRAQSFEQRAVAVGKRTARAVKVSAIIA